MCVCSRCVCVCTCAFGVCCVCVCVCVFGVCVCVHVCCVCWLCVCDTVCVAACAEWTSQSTVGPSKPWPRNLQFAVGPTRHNVWVRVFLFCVCMCVHVRVLGRSDVGSLTMGPANDIKPEFKSLHWGGKGLVQRWRQNYLSWDAVLAMRPEPV